MLTIPVFQPWRSIWDAHLCDVTSKLDELAVQRQKGRQLPPQLHDTADAALVLSALYLAKGKVSSPHFFEQKVEPLLKACVWPRWLLLEEALDHASRSGDLHLSALVLRAQIEELDALRIVATVLTHREDGFWESDAMAEAIRSLQNRVLPRLELKQEEQLIEKASDAEMAISRSEALNRAYNRLSEYVHPNYGSHALTVRPHSIEAAEVFVEAFAVVYEAFLSLPWAEEGCDDLQDLTSMKQPVSLDPLRTLADVTIQGLKSIPPPNDAWAKTWKKDWQDAQECFSHFSTCESNWELSAGWPTNVEAIHALQISTTPPEYWPEALQTVSDRNRYTYLVAQEHKLSQKAKALAPDVDSCDEKSRLPILISGLIFSINLTEHKLNLMARQAATLINAENALGAALIVRSMAEHHAIAVELGKKLQAMWVQAQKNAPDTSKIINALASAEKQLARVLAGSAEPSGITLGWRSLWQETVRKPYNIQGPINALSSEQPEFQVLYGFLSHITHGTVATGGDLLGAGGSTWKANHKTLSAQLAYFLYKLIDVSSLMSRLSTCMIIGPQLMTLQSDPSKIGVNIQQMRILKGQKLKAGRDIFGAGSKEDPYRFRNELNYHEALFHYLEQEKIQVNNRRVDKVNSGIGDRIEASDNRIIFFLNDQFRSQPLYV